MGNWKLEIFRIGLYLTFPVALFHFFNQPAYFEDWVTKTKRDIFPPDNLGHREAIQLLIRTHNEKQNDKIMRAIEEMERKEKVATN